MSASIGSKGQGSTGGTTNLLLQNSTAQQLMKVVNSGAVSFGSVSDAVSLIDCYPVGGDNDFLRFNLFGGVNLKLGASGNVPFIRTNQSYISLQVSSGIGGLDVYNGSAIFLNSAGTAYARFNNSASCTIIPATNYGLRIGDNTNTQNSAILDVVSTTQGFLPPRMTTANRATLKTALTTLSSSASGGMVVYDTDLEAFYYWKHSTSDWVAY
jgi:hypothetical protein